MVSKTILDSLFRILLAMSLNEVAAHNSNKTNEKHKFITRVFSELVIFPATLSLLLGLIIYFWDQEWLLSTSLSALMAAYVGILLYPFIVFIVHRKSVLKILRHPFSILLGNAKTMAAADQRYLNALQRRSSAELKFLRLEVKSEKSAFEKRLSIVVGAIEKIGIFPGFLAVAAVHVRLGEQQPLWLYAIAYATPILYIVSALSHYLLIRLERQVALIDLILENKSETVDDRMKQRFRWRNDRMKQK